MKGGEADDPYASGCTARLGGAPIRDIRYMEGSMSYGVVIPAPATIAVKYESPHLRALGSAQRAALAGLVSSVLAAIIPALIEFLRNNDFSVTALRTLSIGVGITALTTVSVYLQKRSEASNEPVVPVPPDAPAIIPAETGMIGQAVALPSLPLLDAGLLVQLVEKVIRESLAPPEPPPAAIAHRVVTPTPFTGTGANVTIGGDALVKRSHHAAKVPVGVPPVDTIADS
jgi:hypothetical protein